MFDALAEKNPALLIPIMSVVCMSVVFVVWILANTWRKGRQLDVEAALKKDMLARGFAPADVERVLLASADRTAEQAGGKGGISDNEYALVEQMIAAEYDAEAIERVVRAFGSGQKAPAPSDERITA